MEELFESFIKLIDTALDDKSAYTGGHCERVPMLTMMLADAVNRTKEGPLKDFVMMSKDRYELKIAGLLHDCGKITTPVHVVDKATKLHALLDRIELVAQRFEVLKRDSEINMLRSMAEQPRRHHEKLRAQHAERIRRRVSDREFLRYCNVGSEAMAVEEQQRVAMRAAYPAHDSFCPSIVALWRFAGF